MFEIIFHYYGKLENGKFDTSKSSDTKKKVGKKDEEIPLEKVASYITTQLARRDIWIHDVASGIMLPITPNLY